MVGDDTPAPTETGDSEVPLAGPVKSGAGLGSGLGNLLVESGLGHLPESIVKGLFGVEHEGRELGSKGLVIPSMTRTVRWGWGMNRPSGSNLR